MIQPVILAAGKGTRMRSELPKVLHEINGKPMLSYVLEAFEGVEGFAKPIVVVGYKAELVKHYFGSTLTYATQEVQSGTASAVTAAVPYVDTKAEAVLVVYGDQPFLQRKTLRLMQTTFAKDKLDLLVGTVTVPNFEGKFEPFKAFGRMVHKNGAIAGVVEYKNASEEEKDCKELNAGICLIAKKWLTEGLSLVKQNEHTGEWYLTELVEIAFAAQKKISTLALEPQEALGINSPEDAEKANLFV